MEKTLNLTNITVGKPFYQTHKINDLKDMLRQCDLRYRDYIAFNYRDNPHSETISKTYHDFVHDVNSLGSAFIDLGFLNSHIAIIGENRYEWVLSYLATVNGAGIAIPLDKSLPQNEINNLLERGEVDVLIYSDSLQSAVKDILKTNTKLKSIICMNPSDETNIDDPRYHHFYDLLEHGDKLLGNGYDKFINMPIDVDSMQVLLFTSGTSAESKAVMLSHNNICADIMGLSGIVHFGPGASVLSILPLSHTFENTVGLLFPLYLGVTVSISDGLRYIAKNLTEYQPDCLVGVPLFFDKFKNKINDEISKKGMGKKVRMLMCIANALSHIGIDIRRKLFKQLLEPLGGKLRVIVSGGAAIDPKTNDWYESIGIKIYQGYGLTETSPVVAGGNDRRRKTKTCGEPLPGVSIAIANPDSKGSGEIVVKGDIVMLGYWKNEEGTKEAIKDSWFNTGDLGRIDRKGLVHVTGRVKSMIVLNNGKKVFPEEIESLLNKLKYVRESMVWGEVASNGNVELCTKIVLDKDQISSMNASPDDEGLISKMLDKQIKEINKLVPVYKAIRYYVYSYEELVKTTTLKVKRYVETENIRSILNKMAINIKNACGKNIDKFKEMMAKSVEDY